MKSIDNWTLSELKEYCAAVGPCKFCNTDVREFCENNTVTRPHNWDLGDPPPTQTLGIDWHKYPQDKPEPAGDFDKVLVIDNGEIKTEYRNALTPMKVPGVTAWAELPQRPIWSL